MLGLIVVLFLSRAAGLTLATASEPVSLATLQEPPRRSREEPSLIEHVRQLPKFGDPLWIRDPLTEQWQWHPVLTKLRDRIEKGEVLDIECWRTILLEKGYLRWRAKWPINEPFAIGLRAPTFASSYCVRLVPKMRDWRPAEATHREMMCSLGSVLQDAAESYQELGLLGSGPTTIHFELFAGRHGSEQLCPGRIDIDVQPVASIDDILERFDDAAMGAEIARGLRFQVGRTSAGLNRPSLVLDDTTWPLSLSCNVEVELAHDGRVVSTSRLDFTGPPWRGSTCELGQLSPQIVWRRKPADGWSLRLRGTPTRALHNWEATHYWSGEIELDVASLLERGEKPNR